MVGCPSHALTIALPSNTTYLDRLGYPAGPHLGPPSCGCGRRLVTPSKRRVLSFRFYKDDCISSHSLIFTKSFSQHFHVVTGIKGNAI